MRIGVKICGVSTEAALSACIDADVDWVGFVFFDRSPRQVSPVSAGRLIARLPASITPVGLFVSPTFTDVARTLEDAPLKILQVYDHPTRITALRDRFSLPVWHALPVSRRDELPSASSGDRLVIEARAASAYRPGGNGVALDWTILSNWTAPVPWLLAGGLNSANIGIALDVSGASAVDVSSGVENGQGLKDPHAILAFTKASRQSRPALAQ